MSPLVFPGKCLVTAVLGDSLEAIGVALSSLGQVWLFAASFSRPPPWGVKDSEEDLQNRGVGGRHCPSAPSQIVVCAKKTADQINLDLGDFGGGGKTQTGKYVKQR